MIKSVTPTVVSEPTQLSRAAYGATTGDRTAAAPVRIVHIGLGAFARAHQAWYTSRVDDANEWGIAAFTGRSAGVADLLTPQDGLFTLIERAPDGDRTEVITSISQAVDGERADLMDAHIASPETAIITMTVTESGYRLLPDGNIDLSDPAVVADLHALRLPDQPGAISTALGRLVRGLAARHRAGGGALAVVPCDNIPDNGTYVRTGTIAFAREWDPELAEWIASTVSFVSTSVDRITPRATEEDIRGVESSTGWRDAAPVVTEAYSSWTLSGEFPAGRPAWERMGAVFTDEIGPFERRKLWLLNGAHSILAHVGPSRGHETVAAAIADQHCASAVTDFWDEACRHLPSHLDLGDYRSSLLARFGNGRIAHHLQQIEAESVAKFRVRIAPVALAELEAGRTGEACAVALAAWIRAVLSGRPMADARARDILVARSAQDPCSALITLVSEQLSQNAAFVERVRAQVEACGAGEAARREE